MNSGSDVLSGVTSSEETWYPYGDERLYVKDNSAAYGSQYAGIAERLDVLSMEAGNLIADYKPGDTLRTRLVLAGQ